MSLKKQGFLLPLSRFLEWVGIEKLSAQDPEWLEAEDSHPVGLNGSGEACNLEFRIHRDMTFFMGQSDPCTPWLSARLIFNGFADGAIKPLGILIEKVIHAANSRGSVDRDLTIENPSERQVKALCQGFYFALTNQTPIGTDANPVDRIESGAAADDLDARMAAAQQQVDPYANAWLATKGMFG